MYELVLSSTPSEVIIALLKDKQLVELHKEPKDTKFAVGDIYLGKVRKVLPSLNAAFVDVFAALRKIKTALQFVPGDGAYMGWLRAGFQIDGFSCGKTALEFVSRNSINISVLFSLVNYPTYELPH